MMMPSSSNGAVLAVIATILVTIAFYLARSVLEPVAFALFVITLVAPVQARLERSLPAGIALLITVTLTLAVVGILALIIAWSIGELANWVVGNVPRFTASYADANDWLEANEFYVPGLLADRFDARWITRPLQFAAAGARSAVGFIMLAFVFLVLGLKEAGEMPGRVRRLMTADADWDPVATARQVGTKFRRYMAVRALASVMTGAGTFAMASIIGVEEPIAWGVLAFAFNFLPFIGPLIVVGLMTLFTAAQFGSWQEPLLVLVTVTIVQFGIGSYLEPVLAGTALAMSPFIVLLAVFFWGLLWGIPGAFLGVPIMILLLTVCNQFAASRWLPLLLSRGPESA
ncbi:MAG: AI-2E family transporter [Sandarakinorhabdus sp.]|nr:AI-2E family transporter [Sandarakinorhabdus sp.]